MSGPWAPARAVIAPVLLDALWAALWPIRADPGVAELLLWLDEQTWPAPNLS